MTIKVHWLEYTDDGDVLAEWVAELLDADGNVAAPVFVCGPDSDTVLRAAWSHWGAATPALIHPRSAS
jgi:hypothetical protein